MEKEKSYFGEIGHGIKTLATGMKVTLGEYFKDYWTNKSTEQYPENRKTTLHVSKRHRGRLVFKRNEDGAYKCTACTRRARKRRCSTIISTTWATACSVSSAPTPATSTPSSSPTISRTPRSVATHWYFTLIKRYTTAVRCPISLKVEPSGRLVSLTLKRSKPHYG